MLSLPIGCSFWIWVGSSGAEGNLRAFSFAERGVEKTLDVEDRISTSARLGELRLLLRSHGALVCEHRPDWPLRRHHRGDRGDKFGEHRITRAAIPGGNIERAFA